GIEVLNIKGNKVDLRIYAFFNKIIYIYPRRNKIDEKGFFYFRNDFFDTTTRSGSIIELD
ncbi:unnamed protein product, partial [marine sediment metagenome]